MKRTTHIMAAQNREPSDRTNIGSAVAAVAALSMVVAAVATPIVAVGATVITMVALAERRRDSVEKPDVMDTRDGPRREEPAPAASD